MNRGKGWHGDSYEHKLCAKGISPRYKENNIRNSNNYKTYDINYENPEKIITFLKNKFSKKEYARFMNIDKDFDEKSFLDFQSYDKERIDSFVSRDILKKYENGKLTKKELLESSDIPSHIHDNLKIIDGNKIKVNYDGVHAYSLQDIEHEPKQTLYTAMKYEDNIIVFEGKKMGRNLWDDGYIVRPKDVKSIINLKGDVDIYDEEKPKRLV